MAPHTLDSPPPSDSKVKGKLLSERMRSSAESPQIQGPGVGISALFKANNFAKIIQTAQEHLKDNNPPTSFPERVPQNGPSSGIYKCRNADFWTCGFFPGSLYCLLERLRRHPGSVARAMATDSDLQGLNELEAQLTSMCLAWAGPLRYMSSRKDTHDLGFIIQPAIKRHWELYGDQESFSCLADAANSLATRYDERVGAVRSWDEFTNTEHDIKSMEDDFIVIIDSLCNLDLLFAASVYEQKPYLAEIAHSHAAKLLNTHLRKELGPRGESYYSTYHGVNFSPTRNGEVKTKFTAQGYSDDSTWARGQAWAILGYAQTFGWTKRLEFLDATIGLANYFILRMEEAPDVVEENGYGRYVPLWDFDAPITLTPTHGKQAPLRDVSAGLVAANGMLILHGHLSGLGNYDLGKRFLDYALKIVEHSIALAYNRDEMCFVESQKDKTLTVEESGEAGKFHFDSILERSTANFNEKHADRSWDHGLVYADYYFLEFGNRLLDMGLA